MIFPRRKFLSTTTLPWPGMDRAVSSPSQGVSRAYPTHRRRAILAATCSLAVVLVATGRGSWSRAEVTNPRQKLSQLSQTANQQSPQATLALSSTSTADLPDKSHDTQAPAKTTENSSPNSALETQPFDRSESDAGEILRISPTTTAPKNKPNAEPEESLTSGPVSLPGADGWRVVAGPCLAVEDCEQELDREMVIATNRYIAEVSGRHDVQSHLQIDADFVKSHLLHEVTQSETIDTSYGKMRYLTAVLRFDQSFSDELDARWTNTQRKARVLQAGLGMGSVLLLLVVLLGYLKFDTRTGGRYPGRSKMAAVGVLLALVTVGAGISRWILWI